MIKFLVAPATSRKRPRLAVAGRPTTLAVPDRVKLPVANGVPAVGRTRTFCQVSPQVTPLRLELVTVKVSCVVVTDDIATAVGLPTPLILLAELPLPLILVINTVG